MITATATRTVSTLGNATEAMYTIKDSSKIFSILRSNIYSDKMLAVVREYSTNGWDGHILAGTPDRPLKVTLPTTLAPVFKVRDFGVGLSEESVLNIYTTYGESTKESSNDFNGTFGLGSKSAFAYGNSFDIISFFEGTKTMYTAYLDESNIGKIRKVYSEPTTEHNGVEINVAVKNADIRQFNETARKFYQHFVPCPVFINADDTFNLFMEEAHNPQVIARGTDWFSYIPKTHDAVDNIIVMGNVAYTINLDAIPNKSDKFILLRRGYYSRNQPAYKIEAPIGSLSITASRESLEYDARTIAWINAKVDSMIIEMAQSIQVDVDNVKNSAWNTGVIVNAFGGGYNSSTYFVLDAVKFDGKIKLHYSNHSIVYSTTALRLAQNEIGYTEMASYGTYFSTSRLKSYKVTTLYPSKKYIFVANVAGKVKEKDVNSHIRGVHASVGADREIIRVNLPTEESLDKFKKHLMFLGAEIVDIEKYPSLRYSSGRVSVPSQRGKDMGKAKVFEYQNTDHKTKSENWEISDKDVNTDGGVYIRITNYDSAVYPGGVRAVQQRIKQLSHLLGQDEPTIYGVRDSVKGVGSGWVEASDYIIQKTREYIDNENLSEKLAKFYGNKLDTNKWEMVNLILRCKTSGKTSRYNYATAKYDVQSEFLTVIANSEVNTRSKYLIEQIINETDNILTSVESAFFSNVVTSSMLGITPVNTVNTMVDELNDINPLIKEMSGIMFADSDHDRVIKMVTKLESGR
jgi:hypothetical protein